MRVVVAMSGGVDSSVAAALLREQGHEVVGITLRVWSPPAGASCGRCCSPEDVDDARAVAERLGIPFYVADAQELFRKRVVEPFVDGYLRGTTPVPCVACNQDVKFDFLLGRARALDATLATGHYAAIRRGPQGFALLRGKDDTKDQSYFLFTLGQAQLGDMLFPLGELTKAEVRATARRFGLPTAEKSESMELCFVPDGDYASFVETVAGAQPGGEIVDEDGRVVGLHQGLHRYTIGQRRGLGASPEGRRYVARIDKATNRIVVGGLRAIRRGHFELEHATWVTTAPEPAEAVFVKIRHQSPLRAARVEVGSGGNARVELAEPASAVTPGQAAVVYRGREVLGGGWICS